MTSFPDYVSCVKILIYYSVPPNVISHSILTTQTALKVAKKLKDYKQAINCNLILAGALLHDIGRCKSHHIDHGIIGAQLLRKEGFQEELARIAEIHLFAGITKFEASDFGLPSQNYLPESLEEKIITYADNISKKEPLLTIEEVIKRYSKYINKSHPILDRVYSLHSEIELLLSSNQG
ncbi:MAG: HDIG domain-containing metalloprotein [Promethearchaeota archaeon]